MKPSKSTFLAFCESLCKEKGFDYAGLKFSLEAKYDAWDENGWRDGFNKPIKNFKTKIRNVLPFLKPMKASSENGFPPYWSYEYALKLSREDGHKLDLYYQFLRANNFKQISPTHWEKVKN